jgi:hypothetical protein
MTAKVTRTSIASATSSGSGGSGGAYGVLALDPSRASSLQGSGNASFKITGGAIQVNSDSKTAVDLSGNASINATALDVVGGDSLSGNASIPKSTTLGAPSVSDPLASLAAPSKGADLGSESISGNNSATLNAGYYSGGISASGNTTLTLNPGVYVLGPPGLQLSGNANLSGSGVTIFLTTGSSGNSYAALSLAGDGSITLTPPTSGTYNGITIFQDRNTPYASGSDSISGNGNVNVTGAIYLPSVGLSASGNAANLASEIIADTFNISGNGSLNMTYQALPGGNYVYLVQ